VDDGANDGADAEVAGALGLIREFATSSGLATSPAQCRRNIGVGGSRAEFIVLLDSDELLVCLVCRVEQELGY
jgi:hypothetical protein